MVGEPRPEDDDVVVVVMVVRVTVTGMAVVLAEDPDGERSGCGSR